MLDWKYGVRTLPLLPLGYINDLHPQDLQRSAHVVYRMIKASQLEPSVGLVILLVIVWGQEPMTVGWQVQAFKHETALCENCRISISLRLWPQFSTCEPCYLHKRVSSQWVKGVSFGSPICWSKMSQNGSKWFWTNVFKTDQGTLGRAKSVFEH